MTTTPALFLVEDDALIRELLANIRELMAGPAMATLGHTECASWSPLEPISAVLAFDAPHEP